MDCNEFSQSFRERARTGRDERRHLLNFRKVWSFTASWGGHNVGFVSIR